MPKIYERICNHCQKPYKGFGKNFCSSNCGNSGKNIGIVRSQKTRDKIRNALKGRKLSLETRGRMSIARKGKPRKARVGYGAIHDWIRSIKGSPKQCKNCGKKATRYSPKGTIHWSNKDHKYSRNPDDYVELCPRCHKRYDLNNGLTNW